MGPMVASTLKLGIAILNGGNSTVQQVQCSLTSVSVMKMLLLVLGVFVCERLYIYL